MQHYFLFTKKEKYNVFVEKCTNLLFFKEKVLYILVLKKNTKFYYFEGQIFLVKGKIFAFC